MGDDAKLAWSRLVEVDSLKVVVIVDNETDGMSTPCPCCDPKETHTAQYTSEFSTWLQAIADGKAREMNFSKALLAGHGLSLLLTVEVGGASHSLILDGGPRCDLWRLNASELQVDMTTVDAVVLTHWHPDHSVGLEEVARQGSEARQGARDIPDLAFDVHPERPYRRGFRTPSGVEARFNPDVELSALQLPGCTLQARSEPHTLLSDTFYVSGAIPRVTPYETGNPLHCTQWTQEGAMEPDPDIMDERCVAVKVKGVGAVVFTGCSHAGVVNVTRYIKGLAETTGTPLMGVIGGFHLSTRGCEERIAGTVSDLVAELPPDAVVLAGHCTGWRAKAALARAFPRSFQPMSVGGTYVFSKA